MLKAKLKVSGMSCQHCVGRVKTILEESEGISDIQIKLESGKVDLSYDENKLSIDQIINIITSAGYPTKKRLL